MSNRFPNGNLVVETLHNAAVAIGIGDSGLMVSDCMYLVCMLAALHVSIRLLMI